MTKKTHILSPVEPIEELPIERYPAAMFLIVPLGFNPISSLLILIFKRLDGFDSISNFEDPWTLCVCVISSLKNLSKDYTIIQYLFIGYNFALGLALG